MLRHKKPRSTGLHESFWVFKLFGLETFAMKGARGGRPPVELPNWQQHAAGFVSAQLRTGQSILFTGHATIQVLQGALQVDGYLLTSESAPLSISTAGRVGLAITLTAVPQAVRVPLAGSEVVELVLSSSQPDAASTPGQDRDNGDQPTSSTGSMSGKKRGVKKTNKTTTPFRLHHFPGHEPASTPGGLPPAYALIPPDWAAGIGAVLAPHPASAAAADMEDAGGSGEHAGGAQTPQTPAERAAPIAVAVVGSKQVGKSTLARLLVNNLLSQHPAVAFMDLDCGQPELTPPGMVSLTILTQPLIGPPCTHPRTPNLAHYIGDDNPEANPDLYAESALSLLSWYTSPTCAEATAAAAAAASQLQPGAMDTERQGASAGAGGDEGEGGKGSQSKKKRKRQQEGAQKQGQLQASQPVSEPFWPPLVINTHGWVQGLGLDLTSLILRAVQPTYVLQVRTPQGGRRDLPPGPFWWCEGPPETCPTIVMHLTSPARLLAEPQLMPTPGGLPLALGISPRGSSLHLKVQQPQPPPQQLGRQNVSVNGSGKAGQKSPAKADARQRPQQGGKAEGRLDGDGGEEGCAALGPVLGPTLAAMSKSSDESGSSDGDDASTSGSDSEDGGAGLDDVTEGNDEDQDGAPAGYMGYGAGATTPGGMAAQPSGNSSGSRMKLDSAGNRALQWHAWAKTMTGSDPSRGTYEGVDMINTAAALASCKPYVVSLSDIAVHFLHGPHPHPTQIGYALNGAVVGLMPFCPASCTQHSKEVHAAQRASQLRGPQSSSLSTAALSHGSSQPPCLALGLIRANDMAAGKLYLLTDLPEQELQQVQCLLVGLDAATQLPASLLLAVPMSCATPYIALWTLSGTAGAAAGAGNKTGRRKNMARAGGGETL